MDISQRILSDIVIFMKYSKYIPALQRRETWKEICDRNKEMHIKKFPYLKNEIENVYTNFVETKKILPSMRSLQFAGKPIELSPNRIYNCGYLPIDSWESFHELMFLLLGGSGIGFSVQKHHVDKLPEIQKIKKTKRFLIPDSIEGWAESIKVLMKSYFLGMPMPNFDFRDIRIKGTPLKTSGGKAPGPEPLKSCLYNIQKIMERKEAGSKLQPIDCHDIICYIADAVRSGGIRRSALISFFSFDDEEMLTCKFGNWWEDNPQRSLSNNSAVALRYKIKENDFFNLWKKIELSGSGEPGIIFTNDKEVLGNPCVVGETKVLTNKGFIEIQRLSKIYKHDKDIKIITVNKDNVLQSSVLKWCGKTKESDEIYKINFSNGTFQLTNIIHKFYNEFYEEISIETIKNKIKGGDNVFIRSYNNRLINVLSVEKMNFNKPVYDLTADPNFNFFACYMCEETFGESKIKINDLYFYPYDVVKTERGNLFCKDLKINDKIIE